jgi:multisubunit Na+/H+ antiporter MnhE subunit
VWFDRGVRRGRHFLLAEAAVWWMLLFAGYLALVSPLSGGEFILGALLSTLAGCAGVLARRMSDSSFAVSWRWLGPVVWIPVAVLADTLLLARLLWSLVRGQEVPAIPLRAVPLAPQPDGVCGESRQAAAGLMLSLSPGSFMVGSREHPPELLVHVLREQPSVMERLVRR